MDVTLEGPEAPRTQDPKTAEFAVEAVDAARSMPKSATNQSFQRASTCKGACAADMTVAPFHVYRAAHARNCPGNCRSSLRIAAVIPCRV
jgi:hypothetical protein